MKQKISKGWAWKLEEGDLCFWVVPTRKQLVSELKPSPGAKPCRVVIIDEKEYARLLQRPPSQC